MGQIAQVASSSSEGRHSAIAFAVPERVLDEARDRLEIEGLVDDPEHTVEFRPARGKHTVLSFIQQLVAHQAWENEEQDHENGATALKALRRLRQVTRLTTDGHQTPIITSRRDLSAVEIAYRMFARWRQENFFKYLREEFALDALVDYGVDSADPKRDVPNPLRKKLDAELRKARVELEQLDADYGLEAI